MRNISRATDGDGTMLRHGGAFAFFGYVCLTCASCGFYARTGEFFPTRIVEKLDHPTRVIGWNDSGLIASDGEIIKVPGIESLPRGSLALEEAIRCGVEETPVGSLHALVRVHRSCGSDPVVKHVARVNLSDLIEYTECPAIREEFRTGFGEFGWCVPAYYDFAQWSHEQSREPLPPR
jgi:hypothetical protein